MRSKVNHHRLRARFQLRHGAKKEKVITEILGKTMPKKSPHKDMHFHHLPVLAKEVLESINNLPSKLLNKGLIIDATLGAGGHSALILENHPHVQVIGLDQDPSARVAANQRLDHFGSRIKIVSTNFADFIPPKPAIFF